MRRFLPILLIIIIFSAAAGAGGYLLWRKFGLAFPALPPALYAGVLQGAGGRNIGLFIDSTRGAHDLSVALGEGALPSQRAMTVDSSGSTALPLILSGKNSRVRLIGFERSTGRYEGDFIDPITNENGSWFLERVVISEAPAALSEDLSSWGLAYRELISGKHQTSPSQVELDADLRNLELAQRSSPEGRLVALGREGIQRESHWIEQVLQLKPPEKSPTFDSDLQRAYRVRDLLDQIAEQKRLLSGSEYAEPERDLNRETQSEQEFYNELQ